MISSVRISTAILMLIGADQVPGALSGNAQLRGADATKLALDVIDHEDGSVKSKPIDQYASDGLPILWKCSGIDCQNPAPSVTTPGCRSKRIALDASDGSPILRIRSRFHIDKDQNGNPCYCNGREKDSKKQCLDGYRCERHECLECTVPWGVECLHPDSPDTGNGIGGPCGNDDDCFQGLKCNNGICRVDSGSKCRTDEDCVKDSRGLACVNGICFDLPFHSPGHPGPGNPHTSGRWYIKEGEDYCVMDCPMTSGPCCGGIAAGWENPVSTVDECCNDSELHWKKDHCLEKSQSCLSADHNE